MKIRKNIDLYYIFRKVFGRSLQPSAWVVSKNSAEIEMEMNIR